VEHVSDHDLERYYLGIVNEEGQIAMIEEHLLICARCIAAAEEVIDYVDMIRAVCRGRVNTNEVGRDR
jgi:hypothetical protein